MKARPTVARLLRAWEDGWGQPLSLRASIMLSAADPALPKESLDDLSIGARDRMLFALRAEAFGSDLVGIATCPVCSAKVETHFDIRDVPCPAESCVANELEVVCGEYVVQFRLLRAVDLMALHTKAAETEARSMLLERCIANASRDGNAIEIDNLPNDVIGSVVEAMAAADPTAEIELALTCVSCTHRWSAVLDIAAFFWEEVNSWAARLLRDVHVLAQKYSWSEAEILSLSPRRRQMYLELCRG